MTNRTGYAIGLAEVSDEAFMAEYRRRAATGGLYLDAGLPSDPYRGMWQALVAWERAVYDRGNPIYPPALRREMQRIAGDVPDARRVFTLNTTHLGRETEYAA